MRSFVPNSNTAGSNASTLTDRVATRVIDARLAIERRASGGHASSASRSASMDATAEGELREAESLKRVFRELGVSYRRFRKKTGNPIDPGLRKAAYKFREDPSLPSLVAVAAYLDELNLLT